MVEYGIQAGEMTKKTDPKRVANVMTATLEGALRDAQASLEAMLDETPTS